MPVENVDHAWSAVSWPNHQDTNISRLTASAALLLSSGVSLKFFFVRPIEIGMQITTWRVKMKIDVSVGQNDFYRQITKADEVARNINSPVAGELLNKDTPSVVYHPSERDDVYTYHPSTLRFTDKFEIHEQIIRPELGRPVRSMAEISNDHAAAWRLLGIAYKGVMDDLAKSHPTLANKAFGFSVDTDGSLVLVNGNGLTKEESKYIVSKLNRSDSLIQISNRVAQLTIEMVESSSFNEAKGFPFNWIHLDMENFSQTLDLGRALGYGVRAGELQGSLWYNQVMQGEVRYGGWRKVELTR